MECEWNRHYTLMQFNVVLASITGNQIQQLTASGISCTVIHCTPANHLLGLQWYAITNSETDSRKTPVQNVSNSLCQHYAILPIHQTAIVSVPVIPPVIGSTFPWHRDCDIIYIHARIFTSPVESETAMPKAIHYPHPSDPKKPKQLNAKTLDILQRRQWLEWKYVTLFWTFHSRQCGHTCC